MEVLGLDIGGTGIKGAIVDTKKGELVTDRHRIPTPSPAIPKTVIQAVGKIVQGFDWNGIAGAGFPAVVRNDIVKTASNIDKTWIGKNASIEIEKSIGCKTHVVNDADAAGLAEMRFGAGKECKGVSMMVTLGTGIGSALFIDGKLVPNTELGFVQVSGMPGEHYASKSVKEAQNLSLKEWAKRFNLYLNRLEELFWPDLFIVGGSLSKQFEKFERYLELDTRVIPAESRNYSGIIGAALAAKNQFH